MRLLLCLLFAVLLCSYCDGACKNLLNSAVTLNVTNPRGGSDYVYSNCKKLVNQSPAACKDPAVGEEDGLCCKQCRAKIFDISCFDYVTYQQPLYKVPIPLYPKMNNIKKTITSCDKVKNSWPGMCYQSGGFEPCCETCKMFNLTSNCYDRVMLFKLGKKKVNCKTYINNNPCRCTDPNIASRCCDSCSKADTSNCDGYCQNSALGINVNGNQYTCSAFVSENKCWCVDIPTATQYCCKACKKKNLNSCNCRDPTYLTVTNYDANGNAVNTYNTTCAAYINQDNCRCVNSSENCCASCDGVSTAHCACRDNPNGITVGGTNYDCAAYIGEDKCRCVDITGADGVCCESCDQDLSECDCRDVSELTVTVYNGAGEVTNTYTTDCPSYIAADNCRCTTTSAQCCASCDGVSTDGCDCQDSGMITFTRNFANGSSAVNSYSCDQVVNGDAATGWAGDRCYCDDAQHADFCCETCSNTDTNGCDCYDQGTVNFTYTVNGVSTEYVLTCDQVVNGHAPINWGGNICYCKNQQNADYCCATCENADLSGCP